MPVVLSGALSGPVRSVARLSVPQLIVRHSHRTTSSAVTSSGTGLVPRKRSKSVLVTIPGTVGEYYQSKGDTGVAATALGHSSWCAFFLMWRFIALYLYFIVYILLFNLLHYSSIIFFCQSIKFPIRMCAS